jgi:uncharacterized membrane protein YdjX (TVP38/TMEM64 family)
MKGRLLKLLGAGTWFALFFLLLFDRRVQADILAFCGHDPWLAPVMLCVLQVIFASLALPCSPIAAMAGMLWGIGLGFFYSCLATVVASAWTFLLGRYLLRGWVAKQRLPKTLNSVTSLIERHGWKSVAMAYANPLFPGSSLGYVFGASAISFPAFIAGALLGNLLPQLILSAFGHGLMHVAPTRLNTLVIAVALIVAVLLAGAAYKPARRLARLVWSGAR